MIFREITPQRFRVLASKDDTKFRGIVEQHVFRDEHGKTQSFWLARGSEKGWKTTNMGKFQTKTAAGKALLEDNKKAYHGKRMAWKEKVPSG